MECLFCKIIKKELDSLILYEDDKILILLDAFPDADGHTLIIPKKHYDNFHDLPDDLLVHIHNYAKIYGDILMKKLNKESLTILNNYGKAQVIKHYHLHLIPNFKEKPTKTKEEVYNILIKE